MMVITREIATKVRDVVDAGLVSGLGFPELGKMCVEAAVCYALGLPHGDDPGCVLPALRALKIKLNDASWPSPHARAAGLRRLAVAQLGSRDVLDDSEFALRVVEMTIRTVVPEMLRAAARTEPAHSVALMAAADRCECEGTRKAAKHAFNVAYDAGVFYAAAAATAAGDAAASTSAAEAATDAATAVTQASYAPGLHHVLGAFAESVVQILIEMDAPGCQFLDLVPA